MFFMMSMVMVAMVVFMMVMMFPSLVVLPVEWESIGQRFSTTVGKWNNPFAKNGG